MEEMKKCLWQAQGPDFAVFESKKNRDTHCGDVSVYDNTYIGISKESIIRG